MPTNFGNEIESVYRWADVDILIQSPSRYPIGYGHKTWQRFSTYEIVAEEREDVRMRQMFPLDYVAKELLF